MLNELVIYPELEHNASMLRRILNRLSRRRKQHDPLIKIEVSKSRILHNLEELRKLAPSGGVAPVLKSNAYGHGLIEVAEILDHENRIRSTHGKPYIPFLAVDSFFEASALRAQGIRSHILIIGYTRPETIIKTLGHNTAFTITNMDTLQALSEAAYPLWSLESGKIGIHIPTSRSRRAHIIHLKIDTGMRRQGILPEEIPEAIELIRRTPTLVLEGICSHLSDVDNTDESFTEGQINVWNSAVKKFKSAFPDLKYYHLSNTDGHRLSREIDANVSRAGIGIYGIPASDTLADKAQLLPVMSMKTIITSVKKLGRGEHVGYSKTFTAPKDMTIATVPVGYFEGIDRRLSNIGTILVGEKRTPCPLIGRVSMNISVVDVSAIPHIQVGAEAIIISDNTADQNSVRNIAKLCGTITYEVTSKIPLHLKRVVVK